MKASAGRILMLVENPFPEDTRVRNEAVLLAGAGYTVSVIALGGRTVPFRDEFEKVAIYRLPQLTFFQKSASTKTTPLGRAASKIKTILGYCLEYAYFTTGCFALSLYISLRTGFDVIHAHNPPDTLFIVGFFFKIFGKKFVFDHHDLSPELYRSRYPKKSSLVNQALLFMERLSYRSADIVIATNNTYKNIAVSRGRKSADSVFVVRNGPDLTNMRLVAPDPELKNIKKTILGYVGDINPQDGLDYLLRAIRHLVHDLDRTDFYCVIIGSGDALEELIAMASDMKLSEFVWFTGYISHEELLRLLSTADICLDPDPSSPLNDSSTWIKIMEYMALAKPIVTFDLKETRYSAEKAALYVEPNDELEFAKTIIRLMDDPGLRKELGDTGRQRVLTELCWSKVSQPLLEAYVKLLGKPPAATSSPLHSENAAPLRYQETRDVA